MIRWPGVRVESDEIPHHLAVYPPIKSKDRNDNEFCGKGRYLRLKRKWDKNKRMAMKKLVRK
jgi:hypothetical protein